MTQKLTTEQLNEMADGNWPESGSSGVMKAMARELLANREAQSVMWVMSDDLKDEKIISTPAYPNRSDAEDGAIGELTPLYTAPPAPAVVNGRTAEGWMAEALLQKKISDDLRKSAPAVPDEVAHVAAVLELIGSFEADDIDSDTVDLRFEIDDVDTGAEASITEYATRGAAIIRMLAQPVSQGYKLVPVEPTEDMQIAAREWSRRKYGIPIGSDASIGCYEAMLAAAPEGGNDTDTRR